MNIKQSSAALKAVDGFLKSRGVHLGAVSTLELVELMVVALATQPPQDERCPVCGEDEPFSGTCGAGDNMRALCKRPAKPAQPVAAEVEKDAARYRFLRTQAIDGAPGVPVIALPNGMKSGYYLNEETADFAIDAAMAGTGSDESKKDNGNG